MVSDSSQFEDSNLGKLRLVIYSFTHLNAKIYGETTVTEASFCYH